MLFNSFDFAVFLLVVVSGYYLLSMRWQNLWLLAASYFFYGCWDWRFLTLIAFSTTLDFFVSHRLHATEHEARRRALLMVSLVANLGLLGVFKYFNFFIDSFIALGAQIGLNLDTPALRLLPPVGISFYTFQTMAYTIDVYRRELKPERSFTTFALFVCYFPQLVAGPIERARQLLPQFSIKRTVSLDDIKSALLLMAIGLFKKVVVADNAGVEVNRIFAGSDTLSSATLLAGAMLFTLQIYCDFSGYSNMARGMSRLLGIRLVENFKTPYLSANISEFWRRWHISLSQWLRDYLYIPLGGNRGGAFKTRRNLMLTMLLGGLWHGAAWTYVIWGVLNGAYLAIHQVWARWQESRSAPVRVAWQRGAIWCVSVLLTYLCVAVAFVVFRAENLSQAMHYLGGIAQLRGGLDLHIFVKLAMLMALIAPLEIIQYRNNDRLLAVRQYPLVVRSLLYTLIVISLLLASTNDIPFIYFQF